LKSIGYDDPSYGIDYQSWSVLSSIHEQSPDIAQGVERGAKEIGAGDQGMMFGYATNESAEMLPSPIACSHRLLKRLETVRRQGDIDYLRPDAKSQVSVRYRKGRPEEITSVVVSHQTDDVPLEKIRKDLIAVIRDELDATGLLRSDTKYYINPTGAFVLGGPYADAGLTGRKIIVDTYGGVGSHGGGAFSGKDPSKVDRSAAYFARYVAKNIVAAGLAEKCELQVAYAIGMANPLSINVDTYGSGMIADLQLQNIVAECELFDFRPAAIVDSLGLLRPSGWCYQQTAAYGHFGRRDFPWEKTDKAEALRNLVNTKMAA
jgi:S-adenosylmethionine synthetase